MAKGRYVWTAEHEKAYRSWVDVVRPPDSACPSIRDTMRQKHMTPEEIADNGKRLAH